jgi:DNA-3-methyladenine glycosylase I
MDDLVRGADGKRRCFWGASSAEYAVYHDDEWGRPVVDDAAVYERLGLEGFQSGLSWLTILRKRPAFRRAFADFDPGVVARFGDRDVARLLADAGIVRHRGKIEATIANARAVVAMRDAGESLAALVWSYAPPGRRPAPRTRADIAATTPESVALSKALRARGFAFVGPTTLHAAMQAMGVVDDHLVGCHVRGECERERRAAVASKSFTRGGGPTP